MGYLCAACGGVGGLFSTSHAHSDKDSCISELKAENAKLRATKDAANLQNRRLKESIWKHLHIKHERTICALSVGTPERCCEIIMKDAGLNPANGEFLEKCAADQHDWKPIPITFEGWDAECRKCGDKKET